MRTGEQLHRNRLNIAHWIISALKSVRSIVNVMLSIFTDPLLDRHLLFFNVDHWSTQKQIQLTTPLPPPMEPPLTTPPPTKTKLATPITTITTTMPPKPATNLHITHLPPLTIHPDTTPLPHPMPHLHPNMLPHTIMLHITVKPHFCDQMNYEKYCSPSIFSDPRKRSWTPHLAVSINISWHTVCSINLDSLSLLYVANLYSKWRKSETNSMDQSVIYILKIWAPRHLEQALRMLRAFHNLRG